MHIPKYILWTTAKYKRDFTPQFYIFTFTIHSLSLHYPKIRTPQILSKFGVLLLKSTAFQPLSTSMEEGSTSNTRRVREAEHASRRRACSQRHEGGVPSRRLGARGRHADVEPGVEHQPEWQEYMDLQQEQPDVGLQHMEDQELEEELHAMDEEMEDVEPRQRRKKKEKVVDPEPLNDYPGGPHETGLLWMAEIQRPHGEISAGEGASSVWVGSDHTGTSR
ncbi:uncharacterized protein [Medicago truncatula]|uniref:uncharacterized protein n=1 Tax=Medicago truncatula TaxID=3880 RepID=UPI000D2F14D0|nr:uncharacterized protein LOC25493740 [Medicago truncatula]